MKRRRNSDALRAELRRLQLLVLAIKGAFGSVAITLDGGVVRTIGEMIDEAERAQTRESNSR